MTDTTLLPCPCCGGKAGIDYAPAAVGEPMQADTRMAMIGCATLWCVRQTSYQSLERAIAAWNRRTPAPREDGYSAGVRAAAEVVRQMSRVRQYEDEDLGKIEGRSLVDPRKAADRILALLAAPALPDARAGAVGEMRERCAAVLTNEAEASLKLMHSIRQSTITIEVFGEWLGRYAAAIRALPIPAAVPTPACTATDGPASACVYRAPGLATAATFEKG